MLYDGCNSINHEFSLKTRFNGVMIQYKCKEPVILRLLRRCKVCNKHFEWVWKTSIPKGM